MSYPPQGPTGGGGYPPQGGGYPPQGGGMPPQGQGPYAGGSYMPPPGQMPPPVGGPSKRSSIPMVIGILMIIFAGLGLLFTLIGLASGSESAFSGGEFGETFETIQTWETISNLVGLGIGVLHLIAGVMAVRYKSGAPRLAMMYGWISIAWIVTSLILVYTWLKPMLDEAPAGVGTLFGFFFVIAAIFGMAWPIIVLALMSRPAAKKACVN